MNILIFLYALEIGLQPFGHLVMNQTEAERVDVIAVPSFYATLDAGVLLFGIGYVRGGVTTKFWKLDHGFYFSPDQVEYHVDVGLQWRGLSAGFRHYCMHPVVPFIGSEVLQVAWEGSYQQVYVRFENGDPKQ